MGGRSDSSGFSGTNKQIQMEEWEKRFYFNSDNAHGVSESYYKFMENNGIDRETTEEVRKLLSQHGSTSAIQRQADERIIQELEKGSPLGKALETHINYEEKMYSMWVKHQMNTKEPWRKQVFNGDKRVFRKGDRKAGVESWTRREEGADMGGGAIGINHRSSVKQLHKEGYKILGGFGLGVGSPGEAEVTFVKYKRPRRKV